MEKKEYYFNEFGICLNPDLVAETTGNRITVAQTPNGVWSYGVIFQNYGKSFHGGAHGVSIHSQQCPTRNDAIKAACKYMLEQAEPIGSEKLRKCVDKAYESMQPTLFD